MKELYCPEDFPPVVYPPNHIALIYNQFPRRYPGGLIDIIKDLPRIAAMGFNVVWLNPIQQPTQFEARPEHKGSLYAMADDLLFNDDFFPGIQDHQERVKLVQEYTRIARALNMMPIFDLVLNHVGKKTPLEQKFLDQELLNTEPKKRWKDATFFDYSYIEFTLSKFDSVEIKKLKELIVLELPEIREINSSPAKIKTLLYTHDEVLIIRDKLQQLENQTSYYKSILFTKKEIFIIEDKLFQLEGEEAKKLREKIGREKEGIEIPHEQNQKNIIEQIWKPYVERYIGTYGFTGVRADAVINVEPGLQEKVYSKIHTCCQDYHHSEAIVLGEFMAQDAYKHIEKLKGKKFTHIFAPATPYSKLLEYKQFPPTSYYYENDNNKNDIDGVLEQSFKLQEIASVAGILGNHDLAMLKAIVLLGMFGVTDVHSKLDKVVSFLENIYYSLSQFNSDEIEILKKIMGSEFSKIYHIDSQNPDYKKLAFTKEEVTIIREKLRKQEGEEAINLSKKLGEIKGEPFKEMDAKCEARLKEWILRISSTCNGGYYILAGDEYGLLENASVFDNYNEPDTLENKWGGNKDLRIYFKCVNYLLSQLPQATKGDKVSHEKRIVDGINLNIIWRKSAKDNKEYVICTSDGPLASEKILQELKCEDKNIYFISSDNINSSQLLHYNPERGNKVFELINFNQLTSKQILQENIAQYHIGCAMEIAGDKEQANKKFLEIKKLFETNKVLDKNDPKFYYYMGLIDLKLNNMGAAKNQFLKIKDLPEEVQDIQLLNATIEALLKLEEVAAAKSLCERVLDSKENSQNPVTALIMAKIYHRLNDAEEVREWIVKSFDSIDWNAVRNKNFLNELGDLAKVYGLVHKAERCFRQAARFDSDNPNAWLKLANIYSDIKKISEMQDVLYKAGLAYMALHQESKAQEIFFKAIDIESNNIDLNNQLGIQLRLIADHKLNMAEKNLSMGNEDQFNSLTEEAKKANLQADHAFTIAHKLEKNDFLSLFNLGQLALIAGNNKEAKKYLILAFEHASNNIPIKYIEQLGNSFMKLESTKNATPCYTMIFNYCKKKSDEKPDFFYPFYKMGNACFNLGNFENAKKYLLIAFELTKEKGAEKSLILHNQLNYADLADDLIKIGCNKEALLCYKEVIDKDLVDNYQYNMKVGDLYLTKEVLDPKKAQVYFNKALNLYKELPQSKQDKKFLGLIYNKLGDAFTQWSKKIKNPGMLKKADEFYKNAEILLKEQEVADMAFEEKSKYSKNREIQIFEGNRQNSSAESDVNYEVKEKKSLDPGIENTNLLQEFVNKNIISKEESEILGQKMTAQSGKNIANKIIKDAILMGELKLENAIKFTADDLENIEKNSLSLIYIDEKIESGKRYEKTSIQNENEILLKDESSNEDRNFSENDIDFNLEDMVDKDFFNNFEDDFDDEDEDEDIDVKTKTGFNHKS
jgi:hypothetical protein